MVTVHTPYGVAPLSYPGTKAIVPEVLVTQCAAVMARSPAGLSITLAVQKCWPSFPPDAVKSAPTAGVPANAWAPREAEVRCRTARAKPVAISLAAPLAGVSATTAPTASARNQGGPGGWPGDPASPLTRAAMAGRRIILVAEVRVTPGSPPRSQQHLPWSPALLIRNSVALGYFETPLRYLIVIYRVQRYQG